MPVATGKAEPLLHKALSIYMPINQLFYILFIINSYFIRGRARGVYIGGKLAWEHSSPITTGLAGCQLLCQFSCPCQFWSK